jgi:glutathione S-transferase
MRLYIHSASYNARRARAVVHHLQLPVQFVTCDLMSGAQQRPEFLALNPNGKVPVLVDGDFVLWESMAILQYLAGQTSNDLWPNDARARADITRWQAWDLAQYGRCADVFLFENVLKGLFGLGPPNPEALAQASHRIRGHLAVLDQHLAHRAWVCGDTLTLADFSLAASHETALAAGAPVDDAPHVRRWIETVQALPSWRAAKE